MLCAAIVSAATFNVPPFTLSATSSITIGETSILGIGDGGNANFLASQGPYALAASATPVSLSFYVTTAAGQLYLAIYDATGPNGGPGNLVAKTAAFTPIKNSWNTAPVLSPTALPAGNYYWLSYFPSSNTLGFFRGPTSGINEENKAGTAFSSGLPATFPASPSTVNNESWSLYATLTPAGPPAPSITFSPSSPSVLCSAPPGTLITTASILNGDGNPITWSIAAGDTIDFAMSGADLVVGPNGLASGICGTVQQLTIAADQP